MDDGALDDALEAGGGLGILGAIGDQIVQFGFEISDKAAAQLLQVDIAGPHHRRRILIFDQRQQQMLKRRVFVVTLIGERERTMERLFETARERGHFNVSLFVLDAFPRNHFFSIMHCKGC